jgi:hypothetical protein
MGQKARVIKTTTSRRRSKHRIETVVLGEGTALAGESRTGLVRHKWLISVVIVLAFLAMVRLRVADVPLERDEGEYAYSGQLILQGIPPYQLAYNMKFPGTYYAYSMILALFGQSAWGIHAGLALVNAATILIVFFWARRLLGDSMAAALSAIAFGFLSVDRWIMGIFAHATHFVALAAMAGFLVLFRALDSKKAATFMCAGALLGLSVLMKQNGIFFLGLGISFAISSAPRSLRAALSRAGLVAAGSAIPFAVLCLVFLAQGVFGKFWFWTIQYAKEYASQVPMSDAWEIFETNLTTITRANTLIWLLAGAGVMMLWLVRWSQLTRILLTGFLVASLISICPGFYFREHYFILLLPAAGLFCGVAVLSLERLLGHLVSRVTARVVAAVIFVTATGTYITGEWDYFFSIQTNELSRSRYGTNPFIEAPEIARYIQAHTDPVDRIAVLGSEPELYFYANRKSATGYIYTYALMEEQQYSTRMQDEMIDEVTVAHPKYIVYVAIPTSWLARNSKEKILTWSEAYLNQCYDLVGIADILSETETRWVWDTDIAGYTPQSQHALYTFRSKTDTPCSVAQ